MGTFRHERMVLPHMVVGECDTHCWDTVFVIATSDDGRNRLLFDSEDSTMAIGHGFCGYDVGSDRDMYEVIQEFASQEAAMAAWLAMADGGCADGEPLGCTRAQRDMARRLMPIDPSDMDAVARAACGTDDVPSPAVFAKRLMFTLLGHDVD